ncbi:MAG: hypothetical protein IPI08_22440, partial [Betaproteobacteria bacterium]|nr:hypothetical protein [Betaproteobacteria bacterium]
MAHEVADRHEGRQALQHGAEEEGRPSQASPGGRPATASSKAGPITGASTPVTLLSEATAPMVRPCSRSSAALEIRLCNAATVVKPKRLATTMTIIIQP